MKINRRDYKRLLQAIQVAIQDRHAIIDAHRVQLVRRPNGMMVHVVPPEHKGVVARWERDIKAWRELAEKLNAAFL